MIIVQLSEHGAVAASENSPKRYKKASGHLAAAIQLEFLKGDVMAVKKYKPTTPGQRGMTGYTFDVITKSKPEWD
jgi:hypothetical protein